MVTAPAVLLFGVFAVGQFCVVGMPNRILKLGRQLIPFENYLLRMNRRNRLGRNFAVAGVLDINDKPAAVTQYPAHGPDLLAAIGGEYLIANLNIFFHKLPFSISKSAYSARRLDQPGNGIPYIRLRLGWL